MVRITVKVDFRKTPVPEFVKPNRQKRRRKKPGQKPGHAGSYRHRPTEADEIVDIPIKEIMEWKMSQPTNRLHTPCQRRVEINKTEARGRCSLAISNAPKIRDFLCRHHLRFVEYYGILEIRDRPLLSWKLRQDASNKNMQRKPAITRLPGLLLISFIALITLAPAELFSQFVGIDIHH